MALPIAGLLKGAGAVKSLTGGGEKKAKKEKLLPATKEGEGEKQLPGKKSSALAVRPKTKIAPRVRVTSFKSIAPKGGRLGKGGALVYDDLSSRLDTLVQNTNILKQFAKNDLENQKEETKAEKQTAEKAKNAAAESKAEAKAEQKTLKMSLKAPKMDIFGGVFKILRNIAFGTLVMETLRFFSDPEKPKSVLKFVEDNMLAILGGIGAAIAAVVIAPLFGPGSLLLTALGVLTKVTLALGGLILFNPGVLLAVKVALGIGAGLAATKAVETIGKNLLYGGGGFNEAQDALNKKALDANLHPSMLVPVRKTKRGLKSTGRALTPEQEKVKAEIEEERARLEGLKNQRDREVETLKKAGTTPEELRKVHERYKKLINKQETEAEPKTSQSTSQAQPTETKIPGVSLGEAAGYSERRGRVHAGRDIPASSGQPLIVQTDSIIQDTGYDPGYGNYVVFKDANGLEHMYGHMIAPTTYRKGDAVSAGTVVGNVGSTGRSSGPHLHWEVSPNIGEVGFKRSNVFDPILDYGFNQNSPFASGNLATKKPESQAAEIAKQTSYEEPGDQEVLVTMPPPAAPPVMPSSGGGGIAMPQRASMETVLNNYYRFQVLGFLYKQG
jgi:murein DD-endopeptidase MepM/ murein hydrolase activator NlpD